MYVRPFLQSFSCDCVCIPLSMCTWIYIYFVYDIACAYWTKLFGLSEKNWTLIKVTLDNFSGSADAKSEKKQPKNKQTNKRFNDKNRVKTTKES